MLRNARSRVSVLPAKLPFGVAADAAADGHFEFAEHVLSVGHSRGRSAIADKDDAARVPLPEAAAFIAASSTWTPSAINSAVTSGDVSTAPITPLSRCENGRMAL